MSLGWGRLCWCSCQGGNSPWYPAVFMVSAHVLLVSMKATSGTNLRLSPRSEYSFCLKPDYVVTEQTPQGSVHTQILLFKLCSFVLLCPALPFIAGVLEWLLMERINPASGCEQRFTLSLGRTGMDQADRGAGELPSLFWHACPGWSWERFLQNCCDRHLYSTGL